MVLKWDIPVHRRRRHLGHYRGRNLRILTGAGEFRGCSVRPFREALTLVVQQPVNQTNPALSLHHHANVHVKSAGLLLLVVKEGQLSTVVGRRTNISLTLSKCIVQVVWSGKQDE